MAIEIRQSRDFRGTWELVIDHGRVFYDGFKRVKQEAAKRGASGKWRREVRKVRGRDVVVYVDAKGLSDDKG